MKIFARQPTSRIVTFAKKHPANNFPAMRLRQTGRPSCSALGRLGCWVDIWGMKSSCTDRICRFELMEPRRLLAADVSLGAIAGQVTMSADDSGVESVVLRLLGETGNLLDETQTNVEGNYRFANLSPGIYAVLEIQPPGIFDGGALVGSGGGVALDNNLLGEIVVSSGSELVGYNFYELAGEELSEAGAEVDRPLVPHSQPTLLSEETLLADAALWQLYGSSPIALASAATPLKSPTVLVPAANYQAPLPATRIPPTPFYGTFSHADTKSTASDNKVDELGVFREDLEIVEHLGDPKPDDRKPDDRGPEPEDYDRVFELSETEQGAIGKEVHSLALKPTA